MNRQQYENLLNNSNVRKMLDLIAQTEGVKWGYNTLFGNQKIDNLSAHPNLKKQFKQTDGKINYTTAAGRYQFIKPTWDGLVSQLGLKDFSPRSQDIGAIALLAENGALPYVLKGDYRTAVRKSGGTWASLPSSSYAQPKRGWDFVDKQLGTKPPQQTMGGVVGQKQQPTIQRTPMMGNWAEFTKNNQPQERTPFEEGNWSQFTSQNQSNEQVQQRTPMMGNWAEFTQLSKGA